MHGILATLGIAVTVVIAVETPRGSALVSPSPCRPLASSLAYARHVDRATSAKRDVWGDQLLRASGGPTYESVHRLLHPLFLAGAPGRGRLTDSGAYYLPFGEPTGPAGGGPVALHVADGSEVISNRVDGQSLALAVGRNGQERYGSCLARLAPPRLYGGYYPILETEYVDAQGTKFHQESFVTRVPQAASLVSFLRITAHVAPGAAADEVRVTPSEPGLTEADGRLQRGSDAVLFFTPGARFDGKSLLYTVGDQNGDTSTIVLARPLRPSAGEAIPLDEASYRKVRRTSMRYWDTRLAQGASLVVPDPRLVDAEKNLLIQNLLMTWRYSIGNPYEVFEFPESLETATVMGEYGFADVDRAIVDQSLQREPELYPQWAAATRLLAAARYYGLSGDSSFVAQATPALGRSASFLEKNVRSNRDGLLPRERYTADLPQVAYGLQTQTVAWQALNAIADVWDATGRTTPGRTARRAASRLEAALTRAVASSTVRLSDGSLFLPERLLDHEQPYARLTSTRSGSYWNLVVQDALASGFFRAGGRDAAGALAYILGHGSRLLGLVRAGAYALYGHNATEASGTDEVYGLNVARFLADNHRADQLDLSLYGALAAGMTENTFVSGEAASVSPTDGRYDRSMYLPPNSTSNAAFLESLRLTLVHETATRAGRPYGLELAYSTPRPWLAPGRQIVVRDAPTSFGPVSFSIAASVRAVRVRLRVPDRAAPRVLRLKIRRPAGYQVTSVRLDGHRLAGFDPATETVELSGHTGTLVLTATTLGPQVEQPERTRANRLVGRPLGGGDGRWRHARTGGRAVVSSGSSARS